ncbi:double-strand break repair protein AddB [Caenispirillum bisanense]|uniref:ATP-dependent helicase/nuclease subunit B n=1 Tax=Caenispirillum bisanense TaxID=414052 RepID=A0A286GJG1_9PROT|nr:double-strand break repair protein AddB [Caenispirillum bisanense]SOD95671.1 ATP-dependent helicase/nuclease subunit B [Caenispirillum bisanense]
MTIARVHTIAPHRPFLDVLAAGILAETGGDPLALAEGIVLLPTRRACRALREAFLRRAGGRPMLLPRLLTFGNLDEDETLFAAFQGEGAAPDLDLPPPIEPMQRLLALTRLVMAMPLPGTEEKTPPEQAARLAVELGRLLDQVQTEQLSFDALATLVPAEYAEHWQITLQFLTILTEVWPAHLTEIGRLDRVDWRNRLQRLQTEAWTAAPPKGWVIAVETARPTPAAGDLLACIARLPRGAVVLPGLDTALDDRSWEALEQSHPQHGLKLLLARFGVERDAVTEYHPDAAAPQAPPDRLRLVREAMRPAATTDAWLGMDALDPAALARITRLDCPTPREEATAIALMMRAALETDGRTVMLVTPDRDIGRRVAAELKRWGVEMDDSAGRPLRGTPPGIYLRLLADAVAADLAPLPLLALLKHPLAGGGQSLRGFRDSVRLLERLALRGPRPRPGIAGLIHALETEHTGEKTEPQAQRLCRWLEGIDAILRPFTDLMAHGTVAVTDIADAHMRVAEALAATDEETGPERLWAGPAGAAAADLAVDLANHGAILPPVKPSSWPALFESLATGVQVRPEYNLHPRLSILGLIEARFMQADLVILAGLNEGTWPEDPGHDPWMSRPMRDRFGLPRPEWRTGLSAHDFGQLFCAPEVVVTRAERVEGAPTVPSRWLLRLETVMRAGGLDAAMWQEAGLHWLDWAQGIDRPDRITPAPRPAPTPPVEARPRKLSVTKIEKWMRDPYAIYAEHVLKLRALDPLDADPGAADYGSLVHKALETFVLRHPDDMPAEPLEKLLAIGREVFAGQLDRPGVWAFWWPRFESVARWFVAHEAARRPLIQTPFVERRGETTVNGLAGPFTLTATADRIDLLRDGTLAILDYKTGAPPSPKEVAAGYAPQLPLEAIIAMRGGFDGVPAKPVSALSYWRLKGGDVGGEDRPAHKEKTPEELAAEALAGLEALVRVFDDPATPYEARPHPDYAPAYSDYLHLARVKEWAAGGGDGE